MEEIWKDVKNYEGLYQVSNLGNIRSIRFNRIKIMRQNINSRGYCSLEFCVNNERKTLMVHNIVANTFIPNPLNKPVVNHINGIKTDNKIENLEWNTYSENVKHAYRTGLAPRHSTYQNQPNQKKIKDIIENKEYFSIREAARQTGHKRSSIQRSLKFNIPIYNNTYHFIYID